MSRDGFPNTTEGWIQFQAEAASSRVSERDTIQRTISEVTNDLLRQQIVLLESINKRLAGKEIDFDSY